MIFTIHFGYHYFRKHPSSGCLTTKNKQIPPQASPISTILTSCRSGESVLTGLGVDMTILPSGTSIEEVQQNLDLTKAENA